MVALLGIHAVGYMRQNNSGFAGPWGTDRFNLTNQLYNLILGRGPFNVENFVQLTSDHHSTQVIENAKYESP